MEHVSILSIKSYTFDIIQIYYVRKILMGQTDKLIYLSKNQTNLLELSISEEETKSFMILTPSIVKIFKFLPIFNKFLKLFFSSFFNRYYKTFFHTKEVLSQ
jgi:hypothetical protein